MSPAPDSAGFRWQDGDRLILFGPGSIAEAGGVLADGYALLGTPRALATVPALHDRAAAVHEMPPGRVDTAAGSLLGRIDASQLVAIGGGRTIDTAKALAAVETGIEVVAIPTTLSAAEMTSLHLPALGAPESAPQVRPRLVINDPGLCGSQPDADLAGSAANSLGHAVEAVLTPGANPVAGMAARRGAAALHEGLAGDPVDRVQLSLGALLCGYALDSANFGLHHVMAQSLVAVTGTSHRQSNACLLPHTLAALRARGGRAAALEEFGIDLDAFAAELARRAGARSLRELGVAEEDLPRCAELALTRAEIDNTPPRPERQELIEIYVAAL